MKNVAEALGVTLVTLKILLILLMAGLIIKAVSLLTTALFVLIGTNVCLQYSRSLGRIASTAIAFYLSAWIVEFGGNHTIAKVIAMIAIAIWFVAASYAVSQRLKVAAPV